MKKLIMCFFCLLLFLSALLVLPPKQAAAADSGNGLFAEYFQYRDSEFPFSAADKRYEAENDAVNKVWSNNPYSNKASDGRISYHRLSVKSFTDGKKQADIDYVEKDKMAVRWSGYITPPNSEKYRFRFRGNGGVSFYLTDEYKKQILSLDQWKDNLIRSNKVLATSGQVSLKSNKKYALIIEYFNKNGDANIVFEWSNNNGKSWSVVPNKFLYSDASNRTVSVFSLSEAYQKNATDTYNKFKNTLDKNYLASDVTNMAQNASLNILGARTKVLLTIAKDVRKGGLEKTLVNGLGKKALGVLFTPVKAADKFIKPLKSLLEYAKKSRESDGIRALGFLLLKEKPDATINDLPKEYATWCTVNAVQLKDFPAKTDDFFVNMGRIHGTIIPAKIDELKFLVMSAIAETYIFQYTDYIQMIIK